METSPITSDEKSSQAAPFIEPAPAKKRVHIKTYGCQMNVYDSERMEEMLTKQGYETCDTVDAADLVVLNTCHIREKATEKVYSEVGRLKETREEKIKRGEGRMVIAVTGCVAQAEGAQILNRAPAVDLVLGPQAYHELPQKLNDLKSPDHYRPQDERISADFSPVTKFKRLTPLRKVTAPTAFVTVQEGCDKFCTFCVVPYTRGQEWSRPANDIISEVKSLTDQGVREITLLGQNVNAYNGVGGEGASLSLAQLIEKLAKIDGLSRIRYTTSHPNDMTDDLIEAHRDMPQLMPYLHLPVQSGSDRILAAMNRKHTRTDYFKLIEKIKKARPDLALSGDFIVGFPGETHQDFEDTLDLIRQVGYASSFWFKYSARPGTPAAVLDDQISDDILTERLGRIQEVLAAQQEDFKASLVGRELEVLFEKKGRSGRQAIGRSPYLQSVFVEDADHLIGQIVKIKIEGVGPNSLKGMLIA